MKNLIKKLSQLRPGVRFSVFLVLSVLLALVYLLLPSKTLILMEARTNAIEFVVTNPEIASINFSDSVVMRRDPFGGDIECVAGYLVPESRTRLRYTVTSNALRIQLLKPSPASSNDTVVGRFYPSDTSGTDEVVELKDGAELMLTSSSRIQEHLEGAGSPIEPSGCDYDRSFLSAVRLLIWGPATLGRTPTGPTKTTDASEVGAIMLEARISVYGRSLFGDELFQATEFQLPMGLSVETARHEDPERVAWRGVALYDATERPNDEKELRFQDRSLTVSIWTAADYVVLHRWENRSEKIRVSFVDQITKDPSFVRLQIILLAVFFVGEFVRLLSELIMKRPGSNNQNNV